MYLRDALARHQRMEQYRKEAAMDALDQGNYLEAANQAQIAHVEWTMTREIEVALRCDSTTTESLGRDLAENGSA